MHYTVEALLHGKEKLLEYYENAKGKWKELFDDEKASDVEACSDWIGAQTSYFEEECGGRLMAPEIMAWSAMGSLYSIQFGWRDAERDQARRLVEAIENGGASAELKKATAEAADFYGLGDKGEAASSPESA